MKVERVVKLQALDLADYDAEISDKVLDIIYQKFFALIVNNPYYNQKDSKHKEALGLLNKMLEKAQLEKIIKLKNFKIERSKLSSINAIEFYSENKEYFLKLGISKRDIYYYRRQNVAVYILTLLKSITKSIGMTLKRHKTTKYDKIQKKAISQLYYYLSL